MIWLKPKKAGIIGLGFLLSGCLELGTTSYPEAYFTTLIRESYYVDLKIKTETGGFLLLSGKPYKTFMQDLARISPLVIRLIPKHEAVDLSGLRSDLWALSGDRGGPVILASPDADLPPGSDIRIEVSYFLYSVPRCGAAMARRKLDQTDLMTAGFGCAVKRNLVLSLTDPSEWYSSGLPGSSRQNPPRP